MPGLVPVAIGLEGVTDALDLTTCPRLVHDAAEWARSMLRPARYLRLHGLLPSAGGSTDQDAKTLDALDVVCGVWERLEVIEARERSAEMRSQAAGGLSFATVKGGPAPHER